MQILSVVSMKRVSCFTTDMSPFPRSMGKPPRRRNIGPIGQKNHSFLTRKVYLNPVASIESEAAIASQLDVCGTPIITNLSTSGIEPFSSHPTSFSPADPIQRVKRFPMRGLCGDMCGLSYFIRLRHTDFRTFEKIRACITMSHR